ncbi:MAG TPA: DUF6221 family protein [Streptomyces sp.]
MTNIIEFLTARLDEDEAPAEAATSGPWSVDQAPSRTNVVRAEGELDRVGTTGGRMDMPTFTGQTANRSRIRWEADAAHIARHDPARVLAEVAAKRQLLEWCAEATKHFDWSTLGQFGCLLHDPNARATHTAILALCTMAAGHAAHPDYNPDWGIS